MEMGLTTNKPIQGLTFKTTFGHYITIKQHTVCSHQTEAAGCCLSLESQNGQQVFQIHQVCVKVLNSFCQHIPICSIEKVIHWHSIIEQSLQRKTLAHWWIFCVEFHSLSTDEYGPNSDIRGECLIVQKTMLQYF